MKVRRIVSTRRRQHRSRAARDVITTTEESPFGEGGDFPFSLTTGTFFKQAGTRAAGFNLGRRREAG